MKKADPLILLGIISLEIMFFKVCLSSPPHGVVLYVAMQFAVVVASYLVAFSINRLAFNGPLFPTLTVIQNVLFYKENDILNIKQFLMLRNKAQFLIQCNICYLLGFMLKRGFGVIDNLLISKIRSDIDHHFEYDEAKSLALKKCFTLGVKHSTEKDTPDNIRDYLNISEHLLYSFLNHDKEYEVINFANDIRGSVFEYMKENLKVFPAETIEMFEMMTFKTRLYWAQTQRSISALNFKIERFKANSYQTNQNNTKTYFYNNQKTPLLQFFGFSAHDAPTKSEVKKAYRSLMSKFHPDKNQHLCEIERRKAATKAQEININFENLMAIL